MPHSPTTVREFAIITTALLASTAVSQTIVPVSGGGAALQIAAASAAPGSIFIVQPGRYDNFTWTVPNATIVAPQRATVSGVFSISAAAGTLIRNSMRYESYKKRKAVVSSLKPIYR